MRFSTSFATTPQVASAASGAVAMFATGYEPGVVYNEEGTRIDHRVRHRTVGNKSGSPAVLIQGESTRLIITLHQLIMSWNNVTVFGHIEVRAYDNQPILIYQGESGYLVIPCFDERVYIGKHGLRVSNNSIGGDYSVTAYFSLEDI
jgi:hypothetical protein